jgi:YVTN family beta-propeller protein
MGIRHLFALEAPAPSPNDGHRVRAADLAPGDIFAGYRIQSALGEGGMGKVFVAEHIGLRRKVALKLLPDQLAADPRFRERFVRESQLAASLDHPNVVPVYEAGEAEGRLFIAMRYVDGIDLRTLLSQEGKQDPPRTVRILSQVASALDAAHELGLVHRDVKPGNILLARRAGSSSKPGAAEHVYLSDFGLTKRTSSESGITGTGQFVGTLDYAAPEQFEGKALTGATDVYSLGCVLFECLTRTVPYPRPQDAAVMYAHLMAPPPSVSTESPDLPKQIDEVVSKALAKSPEDRYQSAGELVEAAGEALGVGDVSVGATTRRPMQAPSRGQGRRRQALVAGGWIGIVAVIALVAVLLTRGGGGRLPGAGQSSGPPKVVDYVARIDPSTGRVTGKIGAGRDPVGVVIAEGSAWVVNSGDNTVSRIDPVTGKVSATLKVVKDPTAISAGENAVWVGSVGEDSISKIDPASNTVTTFQLDRRPQAVAVGKGVVWIADAYNKGQPAVVMDEIDPQTGRTLREVVILEGVSVRGLRGDWPMAAAGGSLWAGGPSGVLYRVDAGTGKIVKRVGLGRPIGGISVQGDTVWVGTNTTPGVVFEVDASSGQVMATISAGGAGLSHPGQLAADDRDVWVTDAANGSVSRITILGGGVSLPTDVGRDPTGVAIGLGSVWVTVNGGG